MCNLSTRTSVTYVPGLYRGEGRGEGTSANPIHLNSKTDTQECDNGDRLPDCGDFPPHPNPLPQERGPDLCRILPPGDPCISLAGGARFTPSPWGEGRVEGSYLLC